MAHFAKIENNEVTNVIVSSEEYIQKLEGTWIQCSYNTKEGKHVLGGIPLRKNYPAIGDVYDSVRDAFYAKQPFQSWALNEDTCIWEATIPKPEEGFYSWNEQTQTWDLVINE